MKEEIVQQFLSEIHSISEWINDERNCWKDFISREHEQLCATERETSLTLVSNVDSNH